MSEIKKELEWPLVSKLAPIYLLTSYGGVYVQLSVGLDPALLIVTSPQLPELPIVRFHSSCAFGEGFRAIDCDCGSQLEAGLEAIIQHGGVITYAWEEGRGLGILEKLRAIAIQQSTNVNTADAFRSLGHMIEPRSFESHVRALSQVLKSRKIKLASSNPTKELALLDAGFEIVERLNLQPNLFDTQRSYIAEKVEALGHYK
jgi:GTP cyclohydrolase II